jgi:hypothetical protein
MKLLLAGSKAAVVGAGLPVGPTGCRLARVGLIKGDR